MLKRQGIRPIKRLGQNFLIDKGVLKKIIKTAELNSEDTVLEIGPGTGVLTLALAEKAKKIIAVEKDVRMIKILEENLRDFKNVEVIQSDILKLRMEIKNYKIVGNLPFYLTAPVIRRFLELELVETKPQPNLMALIVQKEVAQRICAKPPKMNLLAASVQFYAKPEIISYVSKSCFFPKPKVDAAIIKITPTTPLTEDRDLFFKVVKAGFSYPRKQLINNLSKVLKMDKEKVKNWLLKNGVSPAQRAETLNIKEWLALTKAFP